MNYNIEALTVRELVDVLENYDPDAKVFFMDQSGGVDWVVSAQSVGNKVVINYDEWFSDKFEVYL